MGSAKEIVVRPVRAAVARETICRLHYSGRAINNSQFSIGVFYKGRLEGAMQLGPPMDRGKVLGLVRDTPWNGMLELNRMAFSDALPRNSESRAMAIVFRLLRQRRPDLQWVLSFSDATQCGDGTIYRAAGFVLTGIKTNKTIIEFPDGHRVAGIVLTNNGRPMKREMAQRYGAKISSAASLKPFFDVGAKWADGHQLRYIYFLNPAARQRLTVPVIPFSAIAEAGAQMYRGKSRAGSIVADAPAHQAGEGGSLPTPALHFPRRIPPC